LSKNKEKEKDLFYRENKENVGEREREKNEKFIKK
jgi:hypothetical protein